MGAQKSTNHGEVYKLRKHPSTKASQMLVDSLLQATAELVIEIGYEKTTTNHIATRAGVSIGSLYQYFSNKQGLMAELSRRQHLRHASVFRQAIHASRKLSLRKASRVVASALLGDESGDPRVRYILTDRIPKEWSRQTRVSLEKEITHELAQEFVRRLELSPSDAARKAFVVLHAVQAVIEASIWHRTKNPPTLLIKEIENLIVSYMKL